MLSRREAEQASIESFVRATTRPGMTIGICGPQSAARVAAALRDLAGVRVVTNSLKAWRALESTDHIRTSRSSLHVVPGQLGAHGTVTGSLAEKGVERFRIDAVYVCGGRYDAVRGFCVSDLHEASVDQAFVRRSAMVIAVSSAFASDRGYPAVVCGPAEVNAVLEFSPMH
jgi:DeoR/GlpR family transcriptional regulator of sugar metabolism